MRRGEIILVVYDFVRQQPPSQKRQARMKKNKNKKQLWKRVYSSYQGGKRSLPRWAVRKYKLSQGLSAQAILHCVPSHSRKLSNVSKHSKAPCQDWMCV